jgi:hypothetical protein
MVYHTLEPEIFPIDEDFEYFNGWVQSFLHRSDTEAFLRYNQNCNAQEG